MPSSVVCRCLFRLMRRYFLGRWICLLVSERLRLVWQCCPFGCRVLQGDTLAPYLFIICLDYVLRTSIDKIRENGFELTKRRSKRFPQKQSRAPTTLMTWRYWRIRLIKQRHYCIVWYEPQLALASMSMHTKLNICVTTKQHIQKTL